MKDLEAAVQELDKLSPIRIYRKLHGLGIKGQKGNARNCPVAKYLAQETGYPTVHVGGLIFVPPLPARTIATPYNIASFMTSFDFGDYPDLISEEEL